MSIMYTYFFDEGGVGGPRRGEILMIADANLFIRDESAGLIKERSELELIIGCIYKFKVFKLSPTLFYYIY